MTAPFAYKRGPYTDGRGRRATTRDDPEHKLQCAVAEYLTYSLPPDILWTATLNGAHLGVSQRVKMKAAGLRPGIADIVLAGRSGRVAMIELKVEKRPLSGEQKAWATALGRFWATCRSLEDVEAALVQFGITPRCSIEKANRYAT